MSRGRVCWHELMTPDTEVAQKFYGDLLGWTYETMDMGEAGPYVMVHDGTAMAGGMMSLAADEGIPSNWMIYVTVEDTDAAVALAKQLGGSVRVGPTDIPGKGRFAVVSDDQGATLGIITLNEETPEPGPEHRPADNPFCWYSIAVADAAKAKKFYAALFGWTATEMSVGDESVNTVFMRNGVPLAGLNGLNGSPVAYWSTAIAVEELDSAHAKAVDLGGQQVMPPMDLGTMGRLSLIADPGGAMVSLFQSLQ